LTFSNGPEVRLLGIREQARFRKAIRNDCVCGGIEGEADMSARNFEIGLRISGEAVVPIDNSVVACVDGGLHHRIRYIAPQRIKKVASATARIAGGEYVLPMFFEDVPADCLRCLQHRSMCYCPAKRCGQTDHGCYIAGSLSGDRPRQNAAQTVADKVNLTPGVM